MSIYSDDDNDDIDPANRPGGGLQSEKSPNILARSDVKPILPSSGTADSKLPTRENTVSMKLLLHILNTDHYIWKV